MRELPSMMHNVVCIWHESAIYTLHAYTWIMI